MGTDTPPGRARLLPPSCGWRLGSVAGTSLSPEGGRGVSSALETLWQCCDFLQIPGISRATAAMTENQEAPALVGMWVSEVWVFRARSLVRANMPMDVCRTHVLFERR